MAEELKASSNTDCSISLAEPPESHEQSSDRYFLNYVICLDLTNYK